MASAKVYKKKIKKIKGKYGATKGVYSHDVYTRRKEKL